MSEHTTQGLREAALRRSLQLDEPTHERSEAEVRAEMECNYLWNFVVNLAV